MALKPSGLFVFPAPPRSSDGGDWPLDPIAVNGGIPVLASPHHALIAHPETARDWMAPEFESLLTEGNRAPDFV